MNLEGLEKPKKTNINNRLETIPEIIESGNINVELVPITGALENLDGVEIQGGLPILDGNVNLEHLVKKDFVHPTFYSNPRRETSYDNPIDWEVDNRLNQPMSIYMGHILDWRVRYRSNGYSLGDVEHTLTLAPRESRRITRVDWGRVDDAARSEDTRAEESVADSLDRVRDYSDAVEAEFSEWARGSSYSKTKTRSGGFGLGGFIKNVGGILGGSGGSSTTRSRAQTSGGRETSAREEQKLRDAIRRYGDSLRTLKSSVIQESNNAESVEGVTEVVRNINYGHSLTVVYYKILRHLRIDTELGGVRQCLFVPFIIKPFTPERIKRWQSTLSKYMPRRFKRVLDNLDDLMGKEPFKNSEIPEGPKSKTRLWNITGTITLDIAISRPIEKSVITPETFRSNKRYKWALVHKLAKEQGIKWQEAEIEVDRILDIENSFREDDPGSAKGDVISNPLAALVGTSFENIIDAEVFNPATWSRFQHMLNDTQGGATVEQFLQKLANAKPGARDRIFQKEIASIMVRNFCSKLSLEVQVGGKYIPVEASFTLIDSYRPNVPLRVKFTVNDRSPVATMRLSYEHLRLRAPRAFLPRGSRINLAQISMVFRGEHLYSWATDRVGRDDLLDPATGFSGGQNAHIHLPLRSYEETDLRKELIKDYRDLQDHLNEHSHRYHKLIWLTMDPDERYTILEGYKVRDGEEYRSVASLVERDPVAITGNALVFPISEGIFMKSTDFDEPHDLRTFYGVQQSPSEPMRISLPTGGLYAQALKDPCNALEEHKGSVDWVLENPEPQLDDISSDLLGSRPRQNAGLTPSQLPPSMVNLLKTPNAPSPSGLDGIIGTVSSSGGFQDMAGLTKTQVNTINGLQESMALTENMGLQPAGMAQYAKRLEAGNTLHQKREAITRMLKDGLITKDVARKMSLSTLGEAISEENDFSSRGTEKKLTSAADALDHLAPNGGEASAVHMKPDGSKESIWISTKDELVGKYLILDADRGLSDNARNFSYGDYEIFSDPLLHTTSGSLDAVNDVTIEKDNPSLTGRTILSVEINADAPQGTKVVWTKPSQKDAAIGEYVFVGKGENERNAEGKEIEIECRRGGKSFIWVSSVGPDGRVFESHKVSISVPHFVYVVRSSDFERVIDAVVGEKDLDLLWKHFKIRSRAGLKDFNVRLIFEDDLEKSDALFESGTASSFAGKKQPKDFVDLGLVINQDGSGWHKEFKVNVYGNAYGAYYVDPKSSSQDTLSAIGRKSRYFVVNISNFMQIRKADVTLKGNNRSDSGLTKIVTTEDGEVVEVTDLDFGDYLATRHRHMALNGEVPPESTFPRLGGILARSLAATLIHEAAHGMQPDGHNHYDGWFHETLADRKHLDEDYTGMQPKYIYDPDAILENERIAEEDGTEVPLGDGDKVIVIGADGWPVFKVTQESQMLSLQHFGAYSLINFAISRYPKQLPLLEDMSKVSE